MSSDERDLPNISVPTKKRRIQRACDFCRQKRRACDGLRTSAKKCTYCIANGLECIYSGAVSTTQRKSYTDVLEARLALTEKLLRKLSAPSTHSSPPTTESSEWSRDSPVFQQGASAFGQMGPGVELEAMRIRAVNEAPALDADQDTSYLEIAADMQALSLASHTDQFMGKSSGAQLIKAAMQLKEGYTNGDTVPHTSSPAPWRARRMQYWTFQPWAQSSSPPKVPYVFPPPDLLLALVNLYFVNTHLYMPLLHRPTFERTLAASTHLRDAKFGATVLLVCAIGARFSDDPRAFDPAAPLACGWEYFSQVPTAVEHMFVPPTLYDLQRYCLSIQFLDGSTPQANWSLIGIGLRITQEVGAHRRQAGPPSVAGELWKRAFWVLVAYDRLVSCTLGRPTAMQSDDFDADLPMECDDEYWEAANPAEAFRQPPGVPSRVAFFNAFLRLSNILDYSLGVLYTMNKGKGKLLAVRAANWEEALVAELDSALNKWVDAIPAHLRWDPKRRADTDTDVLWFRQSAALYCAYYHVQMTTHRPFIPTVREGAPTALPSLAICTNAARSCAHVADVACRRMPGVRAIIILPALSTAGVVLLLNVWSAKRTGLPPHLNTTLAEVHKVMRAIRVCEERCAVLLLSFGSFLPSLPSLVIPSDPSLVLTHNVDFLYSWQMAGLFWDVLNELAAVGDPVPFTAATATPAPTAPPLPAHNKRAHAPDAGYTQSRAQVQEPVYAPWENGFTWVGELPMYSAELERPPPAAAFPALAHSSAIQASAQTAYPAPYAAPQPPAHPGWAEPQLFGPPFDGGAGVRMGVNVGVAGVGCGGAEDLTGLLNCDALAIWASAPVGLGAVEWGTYFGVMNENDEQHY
ncbi:fungal-specific transcription factor domain-containing protein [Mycena rosella]|uniref:Fungal-specific transcription factor domain-containing protein n=1 Tax=Mycena rosella TaxID=1033263 RepID=A0AAD7CYX7_MYCRO|nr:fungal-specific transcription factor domain-containing protein [Mycena rosella]